MRLIIANATKQHHDFVYRVPEDPSNRERRQIIPHGAQVYIHDDCGMNVIKAIIAQHERYGLIPASSIPRAKEFVGLCYSVDTPIDLEAIMTASEHNDGVLTDKAIEMRKETAVAIQASMVNEETGISELAVEIVQDDKSTSAQERMAQGVRIETPGRTKRRSRE